MYILSDTMAMPKFKVGDRVRFHMTGALRWQVMGRCTHEDFGHMYHLVYEDVTGRRETWMRESRLS